MKSFNHEARLQARIAREESKEAERQRNIDEKLVQEALSKIQACFPTARFGWHYEAKRPRVFCSDCKDRGFCVDRESPKYQTEVRTLRDHLLSDEHAKKVRARELLEERSAKAAAHMAAVVKAAAEKKAAERLGKTTVVSEPLQSSSSPARCSPFNQRTSSPATSYRSPPPTSVASRNNHSKTSGFVVGFEGFVMMGNSPGY